MNYFIHISLLSLVFAMASCKENQESDGRDQQKDLSPDVKNLEKRIELLEQKVGDLLDDQVFRKIQRDKGGEASPIPLRKVQPD